ncbi:MAG: sensor histidine kinase [Acidobacteriota bacterium]|nr:sensor histidine kinase [Acidobacteriota bacterium]
MNITRRRGTIAIFITLGVFLTGLAIALNVGWLILNERTVAFAVLGVILFSILIAGVVLNTIFLVREIRRNERQNSFLNAVTHELKTPIASIRLYLETLLRRPIEEEQRQKFYSIMLADSDRLLATVEQVLKAGELGQRERQLNRTVIDVTALVAECIAITLQRRHLQPEAIVLEPVSGEVKLTTLGIHEDLRTAVLNLLDNAVKYSPNGVHVRCHLSIHRYTWISLRITDTGMGLQPNQLKRIFKRFYRVPGRDMIKIKGTGLGLFLVRNIARQHGGDATAASPGLGFGSTFTLTLPLNTAPQAAGPRTS